MSWYRAGAAALTEAPRRSRSLVTVVLAPTNARSGLPAWPWTGWTASLRRVRTVEPVRPHATLIAATPNLWFGALSLEVAEYYVSIIRDSRIVRITHIGDIGPADLASVLAVDFELAGQRLTASGGSRPSRLGPAVAMMVRCKDATEAEEYGRRLSMDGCRGDGGWLVDRFGMQWRVLPSHREWARGSLGAVRPSRRSAPAGAWDCRCRD